MAFDLNLITRREIQDEDLDLKKVLKACKVSKRRRKKNNLLSSRVLFLIRIQKVLQLVNEELKSEIARRKLENKRCQMDKQTALSL